MLFLLQFQISSLMPNFQTTATSVHLYVTVAPQIHTRSYPASFPPMPTLPSDSPFLLSAVILSHPCSKPQPSLTSLFLTTVFEIPSENKEQSNSTKNNVGLIAYLYGIGTFYPSPHAWMM